MSQFLLAAFVSATIAFTAAGQEPIDIGSRLELFVDDFLIDKLGGTARQQLQKPMPQEVVLITDRPWEGNVCAYYTLFQDGDRYRMYYRGAHADEKTKKSLHAEVACYAESKDGVHWERPNLGLVDFGGSKENNIVWDGPGGHNFTPFKDTNPACTPEARYKAVASGGGLFAFQSADGIRWQRMSAKPVITNGNFDSQNLAFWDAHAKLYRSFHRKTRDGVRDIMRCTSTDFLNWTEPVFLEYPGAPREHLYTNAIQPYERAPHILLGFPTRFLPKSMQVEPTFMASRDGEKFQRWTEPVIPLTAPKDRDGNRSNYMAWGMLKLPGKPNEYSVYGTEAYYRGPDSRLRRFTYRVDGFVAVQATEKGGELLTKPIVFTGRNLAINFTAGKQGSLRVEVQDAAGKAVENFRLDDCPPIRGDAIEHTVSWKSGSDVAALARRGVRLRFELTDADLFSLRFKE